MVSDMVCIFDLPQMSHFDSKDVIRSLPIISLKSTILYLTSFDMCKKNRVTARNHAIFHLNSEKKRVVKVSKWDTLPETNISYPKAVGRVDDFAIPRLAYHLFYWATEWPLPLPLMPPSLPCYKRPALGDLGDLEPCNHDLKRLKAQNYLRKSIA